MAVAVGGYAAVAADLRAVAATAGLGILTFVGFLANRFGELTGASGDVWAQASVIVFAAVLGVGNRHMRSSRHPESVDGRGLDGSTDAEGDHRTGLSGAGRCG